MQLQQVRLAPGSHARMRAERAHDNESNHVELVRQEQGSMQLLRIHCLWVVGGFESRATSERQLAAPY